MANQRTDSKSGGTVKVTLVKSPIGFKDNQEVVVRSLGLRRIRHTVELKDTPGCPRHDPQGATPGHGRIVDLRAKLMSLNNLRPPKGAKHVKKRIGRGQGSGNGKTAGRGHKGAKSRSGFKFKRGFEGGQMPLHRRVPEARVPQSVPRRVRGRQPRHAGRARRKLGAGTVVTPELLREHGVLARGKAPVKVLARGDVAQGADGAGAQVQRQGGGEDRGGRRHRRRLIASGK